MTRTARCRVVLNMPLLLHMCTQAHGLCAAPGPSQSPALAGSGKTTTLAANTAAKSAAAAKCGRRAARAVLSRAAHARHRRIRARHGPACRHRSGQARHCRATTTRGEALRAAQRPLCGWTFRWLGRQGQGQGHGQAGTREGAHHAARRPFTLRHCLGLRPSPPPVRMRTRIKLRCPEAASAAATRRPALLPSDHDIDRLYIVHISYKDDIHGPAPAVGALPHCHIEAAHSAAHSAPRAPATAPSSTCCRAPVAQNVEHSVFLRGGVGSYPTRSNFSGQVTPSH
jgi:hypothetical protein